MQTDTVPKQLKESIKLATVEFAGVKIKTHITTGKDYLGYVNNAILKHLQFQYPNLATIIISEKKYSFTPDEFKSDTRANCKKNDPKSIAHLKSGDELLGNHILSKSAAISTTEGKRVISNYLARNVEKLSVKGDITVIVDSEL